MFKNVFRKVLYVALVFSGLSMYMQTMIPDTLYYTTNQQVNIKSLPMVTLSQSPAKSGATETLSINNSLNYQAKLMGVFPIKNVAVVTQDEKYLSVSGEPFGIKMFSDGVIVVGFSDVHSSTGYTNPAKIVGLKMGDIITSMNGLSTKSKKDVEKIILQSEKTPIVIEYVRDGKTKTTTLIPEYDTTSQGYRTGMWVRDSSAGIGTITFYDTANGTFGGLGHAIKDVDTQQEIPLLSGEIVPVKITGIVKSKQGSAGELKGSFLSTIASGKVLINNQTGVYGTAFSPKDSNMMPLASPQEITNGQAYIYTTINGTEPKRYEIQIEKVSLNADNINKNMVVRITDKELLALTGGIVQGMSGSPIVQNGKLVGAVTHVFVNDPTRGYGIFAENMLSTAENIE